MKAKTLKAHAKTRNTKGTKVRKVVKKAQGLTPQQKAERTPEGTLAEWNGIKKGQKTPQGLKIDRIRRDPNAVVGHNVVITVRCLETNKAFDCHAQDLFQVKYHPSIRQAKKNERRRELRAALKAGVAA